MNEPEPNPVPSEQAPADSTQFNPRIGQETEGNLPMAIVGGVIAALIGAGVWAGILIATEYEIGILAWGLGVLTGFGVVLLGRGGRPSFGLIAAICALFSIFMGKYFAVGHLLPNMAKEARVQMESIDPEMAALMGMVDEATLNQAMEEELGFNPSEVTYASVGAIISFMIKNAGDVFSVYDLLWIGLAVASAWKIAGRAAFG